MEYRRGFSTRLIGRSEIISRSGNVSSSYSCSVSCGNSYYNGGITPIAASVDIGDTYHFSAWEIDQDGYGNLYGPYGQTANWTADGSYIYDGLVTATGAGDILT